MRTAQDAKINLLAHYADRVPVSSIPDLMSVLQTRAQRGESFRCFYRDGAGKKYKVTLFIAGKQRIVGLLSHPERAARFADLAIRRFWQYRRTLRPCSDSDLNFSLAQTEDDAKKYPEWVSLLDQIESHFISNGTLESFSEKEDRDFGSVLGEKWKLIERLRKKYFRELGTMMTELQPRPELGFYGEDLSEKINAFLCSLDAFKVASLHYLDPSTITPAPAQQNETTNT